ncbi:hypothetical protein MPSI1_003883 [Malassezia psittaci]|uniref:Alpha/beta hydrolase fold-3 domain-containing protein n=1 Tax=Malassezia psittaci TaxID=1821823 RepID=A0AAF0FAB3_9BASI|nr:hypothetical protein MPSI1_003883 [Malassezia psittaci]
MTISTLGILAHVTPELVKNALKHYVRFWTEFGQRTPRESANAYFYDQAFHLVRVLAVYITHHITEDAQKLTDTEVPVPPWGYSSKVMIPMQCCDNAASYVQEYFGPDQLHNVVGGARWWQMRTLDGIPGEWISQYSDYHTFVELYDGKNSSYSASISKHIKRHTEKRNPRHEHGVTEKVSDAASVTSPTSGSTKTTTNSNGARGQTGRFADTQEERDRINRVMLYIHGGAYYFGSINTHRFQILRIARKFGGFSFAVNYRKAPQFPFPCALQDCLAAYLYLIDPPENAKHPAIDPSRIVIAGDSAGGGLSLALLQLIRDTGLPLPAGAVLISPWVDLTHSFPSILKNTKTDYIPPYSFIHKPSTLWPLPEDTGVFERKSIFSLGARRQAKRASMHPPQETEMNRLVKVVTPDGGELPITSQIQLYATNGQLFHPLCSPALSGSLGGLPPLYILAGNDEVLRDEIIYTAHKAANPEKYVLNEELMNRFPNTRATYEKYRNQPTQVHLQVFDGQCHVFTMFMQTITAKYAFRAIASFIKYVTGAPTCEPVHSTANHPSDQHDDWQYSSTAAAEYGPVSQQQENPIAQSKACSKPAMHQENLYSGKVPLQRPEYQAHMIRERVDVNGRIRPMEPASQMSAMQMPVEEIGQLKLSTYHRFQEGHTIWDNKFKRTAARVQRRRAKLAKRAQMILNKAQQEGLLEDRGDIDVAMYGRKWKGLASYGPADLINETPPRSAVVGRRDTPDALAILKLSLHLRAKRRRELGLGNAPRSAASSHYSTPLNRSQVSLADDEEDLQTTGGEHHPHTGPAEPLSKRFGFWKCT